MMEFKMQVFRKVFGKFILRSLISLVAILIVLGVYDLLFVQPQYEKLAGEWKCEVSADEEQVEKILEQAGFDEEEISIAREESFDVIIVLQFTKKQKFHSFFDTTATKTHLRSFWEDVFESLYKHRDDLASVYGDITDYTKDDFQSMYAHMCGADDFDELIDSWVEEGYDWDYILDYDRRGTFIIKNKKIVFSESGKSNDWTVLFQLEENELTLTYSDGKEHYTRITE